MAISFTPARINRGLIKKAAQQTGFMTSVLNRINTDRQNAREDARNKELDALKNRELDLLETKNQQEAEIMGINKKAALEEKKLLAKTAQGQVDSGLQFYNDAGELEAYYLPTLKGKVSGGYKQKDYMQESRMQLGQILQDLQGEKAKGILKAISESPKNWQNKVIDLLETASQKDDTEDGGFTYNGLIMRDFKGYNDRTTFKELFDAFKSLEGKNTSLEQYALNLYDERFGMNDKLKSTAAGMNYSMIASKNDPKIMNFVLYGEGTKMPSDISEEDLKKLGPDFGVQGTQNEKLNTILSLAKSSGTLTKINRDAVAVAHLMLENRDYLGLDDIINNAGGARATDLRLQNLVKNLQFTTSKLNPEQGFQGVQPLALRQTNAEALILATMAEKHISNQYKVERTKNGIKAIPLKPNNPIDPDKDGRYYNMVKESADQTINTTNQLFDINQQIARIEGGAAFRLGSKLGKISDLSTVAQQVLKSIPDAVSAILGETDDEFDDYRKANVDDYFNTGDFIEDVKNKERLADAQKQYTENMAYLAKLASEEKNDNLKKVYILRMRAEGIKVRTAFRIASLVQGGGTGGGRTISNQDFEVIYNSLFKTPGTPEAFTAAMAQVRHEMLKQRVTANTYLEYQQFGFNAANDAVDLARAYLDAQMAEHYQTGGVYNATTFLKEIPETLIMSVQKNDMVGIFGERTFFDKNNPGKYKHEEGDTSYLTALGVEDSQIKLLTNQIDEVFSDNKVTDDERKVVAGLYAVSVVPLIVKDRADRNYPSKREDIKKDLIKFQFGNAFADQMLNSYEAKYLDDAYKIKQEKEEVTPDFTIPPDTELRRVTPKPDSGPFTVSLDQQSGATGQTIKIDERFSPESTSHLALLTLIADTRYADKAKELGITKDLVDAIYFGFPTVEARKKKGAEVALAKRQDPDASPDFKGTMSDAEINKLRFELASKLFYN